VIRMAQNTSSMKPLSAHSHKILHAPARWYTEAVRSGMHVSEPAVSVRGLRL
jgi:hypothetical protein